MLILIVRILLTLEICCKGTTVLTFNMGDETACVRYPGKNMFAKGMSFHDGKPPSPAPECLIFLLPISQLHFKWS